MEFSKAFIEQTAKDYDMPIHDVYLIAKLFPNEFYQRLELYIYNRSKLNSKTTSKQP
jgi:hypothetical protein